MSARRLLPRLPSICVAGVIIAGIVSIPGTTVPGGNGDSASQEDDTEIAATVMVVDTPFWVFVTAGDSVEVDVNAGTNNPRGRSLPTGIVYAARVSDRYDPDALNANLSATFRFDDGARSSAAPLVAQLTIDVSPDSRPGIYQHRILAPDEVDASGPGNRSADYVWHAAELRLVVVPTGLGGQTPPVAKVAAGAAHSLALLADGSVWAWGNNASGQLGDGTHIDRNVPVRVTGLPLIVTDIAAGDRHSIAVGADGSVYTWGANESGQLGITAALEPNVGLFAELCTVPLWQEHRRTAQDAAVPRRLWLVARTQITAFTSECESLALPFEGVERVAAGVDHTIAMKTDGTVWTWGGDASGQLGNRGEREQEVLEAEWREAFTGDVPFVRGGTRPYPVPLLLPAFDIAAGGAFSLAVLFDGSVAGWGESSAGQLTGIDPFLDRIAPIEIPFVGSVQAVAAGRNFSLARRTNQTGFIGWGSNSSGQLGLGHSERVTAAPRPTATHIAVAQLAAGAKHGIALDSQGGIWGWGGNGLNQLGGATPARESDRVLFVPGVGPAVGVAAGGYHSLARTEACRNVFAWGNDADGQLGQGSVARSQVTPLPVYGLGEQNADPACRVALRVFQTDHGHVDAQPVGYDTPACRGVCSLAAPLNSIVRVTATPDSGWEVAGWHGDCTGASDTIQVPMDRSRNCFPNYRAVSGNAAPVPAFDFLPGAPETGELVTFDAGASSDDGAIVTYLWDFEDDGNFDDSGVIVTKVYATAGTYTVRLHVVDDTGAEAETTRQVVVAPPAGGQSFTLSINITGDGQVTDGGGGITCGADCTDDYPAGTAVDLTADAAIGSQFDAWGDDCSAGGTNSDFSLTMDTDKLCSATFSSLSANTARLTVVPIGFGRGNVASDVAGIDCELNAQDSTPDPCAFDFPLNDTVILTVTPDVTSGFIGWGADCTGANTNGTVCTLEMDSDHTAEVNLD